MLSWAVSQLVERNLAKVEVTPKTLKIGNLVCRSKQESLFRNEQAFLRLKQDKKRQVPPEIIVFAYQFHDYE